MSWLIQFSLFFLYNLELHFQNRAYNTSPIWAKANADYLIFSENCYPLYLDKTTYA